MLLVTLLFSRLLAVAVAQQAGHVATEDQPMLTMKNCGESSFGRPCYDEELTVTLDSQYRWVHEVDAYDNCFADGKWDAKLCPTAKKCAEKCAIDGVDAKQYKDTYGINTIENGIEMTFGVKGEYGWNYGSRVYVMEESKYKIFKLKNREFTFDVDMSNLPCGLNGAVYFVGMDANGEKGVGQNEAGAKYGLGYCDAQCPRGQKFVKGEANLKGWSEKTGEGHYGACCAELDLWEANMNSSALTVHPCAELSPTHCEGDDCSGADICDKDGCQYNPYHLGHEKFYGPGFKIDSKKPVTIVTQFITEDETDDGDLVEIRRFYMQGGEVISNPEASVKGKPDVTGNSLNEEFCSALGTSFGGPGEYMKKMGQALDKGMVLILSVWDDPATNMAWLDASDSVGQSASGSATTWNGPCYEDSADVREKHADASVKYYNFRYGEMLSTCPKCKGAKLPPSPTPPHHGATTEGPIFLPPSPTPAPEGTQAPPTSLPPPTPLYKRPVFLAIVLGVALISVVAVGSTWLQSLGWQINFGRPEPAHNAGARNRLVSPRE